MASVFLSYDRDDSDRARHFARVLETAGHQVWWDLHVRGGAQFSKVIEEALKAADVVVVLWSANSIESAWVRDEAGAGRDSGRLVPVTIDGTLAPLGFRQFQTIDLSGWRGRGRSAKLSDLIAAIEAVSGAPAERAAVAQHVEGARRRPWVATALAVAAMLAAAVLFLWQPWKGFGSTAITTVSIAAADAAPESKALARDLVVKLGAIQTGALGSMRLAATDDQSGKPDLLMEVGMASDRGANRASLLLKEPRRGAVLWSREFEQGPQSPEDLKQQLAFTSANTLDCALEERSAGVCLDPETSKSYLNACAQMSEILSADPTEAERILSGVVHDAPRFKRAWARLLLAEIETTDIGFNNANQPPEAMAAFRKHIDQARKLEPDMPEVALAEASLVQANDFSRMMALIEPLATRQSDNADVLDAYSMELARVGRSSDAVKAASKAVRLDPLSPSRRNSFISALAYSGQFAAAQRELAEAERLWPGTATVEDAKFRLHYRYGDPKLARAIFEKRAQTGGQAVRLYLDARTDPSPANVQRLLAYVRDWLARMENPSGGVGTAAQAYAEFAGKEQVFDLLLGWPSTRDIAVLSDIYFRPAFRETRRDPRFMRLSKRAGLVDYWEKSGKWPDFCFVDTDQPYDCKAEAAKLK